MTIAIRLILVGVIPYIAITFTAHALRAPSFGALAGDVLAYGFWILLCLVIWRRVGSRRGTDARLKGNDEQQ